MTGSIREQLEPMIRDRGIRRTARDAGISPSLLCNWLRGDGRRRMGDEQLARLAAALGVTFTLEKR